MGVKMQSGEDTSKNQVRCCSNLLKDDESEVSRVLEELSCPNLPFDELIKQLNGGYYLDTFEFGSIQIEDVPWPTVATDKNKHTNSISAVQQIHENDPKKLDNKICKISEKKEIRSLVLKKKPGACTSNYQVGCRSYLLIDDSIVQQILDRPRIDSDKFDDKKFKIPKKKEIRSLGVTKKPGAYTSKKEVGCPSNFLKDDESGVRRVLEKMSGSDLPLNHSCSVQDKTSSKKRSSILSTIVRKKEGTDNNTIIKSVSVSSTIHTKNVSSVVLGCPTNKDDEEKKLECSRIKMRRQYEEIESEKKRRRIQVIEHQKPLVADQPQTGKRVKKVPLVKKLQNMRNSQLFSRRMKPLVY